MIRLHVCNWHFRLTSCRCGQKRQGLPLVNDLPFVGGLTNALPIRRGEKLPLAGDLPLPISGLIGEKEHTDSGSMLTGLSDILPVRRGGGLVDDVSIVGELSDEEF